MADVPLMSNPMTTQGDIVTGGASGAAGRLGIGTAGQVLTVNAGATAPEWAAGGSGGGVVPWRILPDYGGVLVGVRTVGAANRAIYVPCVIPTTCTLTGIRLYIGTSSGNLSVALYDSGGTRVATSGGVASPGTSLRDIAFTGNYSAAAGRFYLAISADNNTMTFGCCDNNTAASPAYAFYEEAAYPLPASMTSAGATIRAPVLVGLIDGVTP